MKTTIVFMFLVIRTVGVLSRDLSEQERTNRAAFIQRLINKEKYLEGRVKLVGGTNIFEGNVYIYHAGRWGAVCDDSWDDAAAQVICKAFNSSGTATRGGQYGEALEKYWMDDVVCQGDESSLPHCIFTGWGSSDCETSEAAGVICKAEEPVNLKKPKELLNSVLDIKSVSLRLAGGRNNREGRVERSRQKIGPFVSFHTRILRSPIWLPRTVHNGNLFIIGSEPMSCTGLLYALEEVMTDCKLITASEHIYHNGDWGGICADGWTLYEASTVCRHLALGFAEQALQTDYFGNSKVVLSGVQCEGNETHLFGCRHQEFGDVVCPGEKGHVAAVICTQNLADLLLETSVIERTAHLQDVMMVQLQCAMEENCLSKSAYEIREQNPNWQFETRRLLRFTASSLNIGNDEFRPYLPKHLWQWHLCHMHYHSMEVFATFDVLDATGRRVAEGHKASFCLEDNTCLPGIEKKYSCLNYGDQGVSVNCSDVYKYNIDCQWVDVTDVVPGDYTFKVAVNPHARVAEQTFHNNAASCSLRLTDQYALVYGCRHERP